MLSELLQLEAKIRVARAGGGDLQDVQAELQAVLTSRGLGAALPNCHDINVRETVGGGRRRGFARANAPAKPKKAPAKAPAKPKKAPAKPQKAPAKAKAARQA